MARLRYDGLTATLDGTGLTSSATSIGFAAALTSMSGAVPTIAGSDYLPLIIDSEIVYLTAYTAGATTGTITRAQESTTAAAHAAGADVIHGPTAADFAVSTSAGWSNPISLPLSTTAGWTAGAGTWAVSGGVIRQSNTANGAYRLHLNTRVPLAEVIAEVDVRLDTTPNNISSRGGFVFGTPAASDGGDGMLVALVSKGSTTQATAVDFEKDTVESYGQDNLDAAITNGTWTTFRVHKVGVHVSVYINGTLMTTHQFPSGAGRQLGRLALYSYGSDVSFRNLDLWTPALP